MLADELLRRRKDRAIAIALKVKERDVDPILLKQPGGERASRMLRKVILDVINDFYADALDVAKSGEAANFWFNDEVWERRFMALFAKLDEDEDGAEPG